MKLKTGSILKTIAMILFILCSGSQFGIDNAKILDVVFFLVSTLCYFIVGNKKIQKADFASLCIILGIFWGNYLIFARYSPITNGYISYSLRAMGTLFFVKTMNFEEFKNRFIQIMIIIALVSIGAYIQRYLNHSLGGYMTTFGIFRTALLNGNVRNSGIFWEPGAYQVFINIAIFFVLYNNQQKKVKTKKDRYDYYIIGLFIITLISTLSTVAYLVLMINLFYLYYVKFSTMRNKNRLILGVPMVLALVFIIYEMVISDTVVGKFVGGGNVASTAVRYNDLLGSWYIISHFPFGLGHGTSLYYDYLSRLFIKNNSTGLIAGICQVGWPFAIYYVFKIFSFSKHYFGKAWGFFILLIFVSGLTENLYFYPIYFILLFTFAQPKEREIKRNESFA